MPALDDLKPNIHFAARTWGWTALRVERLTLTYRGTVNIYFGVRVLWFKIFICKI